MAHRKIEVNCTKCGHLYDGNNPAEAVRILHKHGTETKHTTKLISRRTDTTTIEANGGPTNGRNIPS